MYEYCLPRYNSSVTFCVTLEISHLFIGISWLAISNKVIVNGVKVEFIGWYHDTETRDSSWSMLTSTPAIRKQCKSHKPTVHVCAQLMLICLHAIEFTWPFWTLSTCVPKINGTAIVPLHIQTNALKDATLVHTCTVCSLKVEQSNISVTTCRGKKFCITSFQVEVDL